MHEQGNSDVETFRDSFRLDKGRRVLAGMLTAERASYFMIVDDDDFVSSRIVEFVSQHQGQNGWWIENGYIWGHGGPLVARYPGFSDFCGTSLIIRSDLYQLPNSLESAQESYLKSMLGSHIAIKGILSKRGTPLAPLPFLGAVYRIGHTGAHSKSNGLIRYLLLKRELIKRPDKVFSRIARIRLLDEPIRREFFGEA
jgi:hypothetical protein